MRLRAFWLTASWIASIGLASDSAYATLPCGPREIAARMLGVVPFSPEFIDSIPDHSFVDRSKQIARARAHWAREFKKSPTPTIDPATLASEVERIGFMEAYLDTREGKPLINLRAIREGTQAQKIEARRRAKNRGETRSEAEILDELTLQQRADLADIVALLKPPLSGREFSRLMGRLYRLQASLDSSIPYAIRRFLPKFPSDRLRARIEAQLTQDFGGVLHSAGILKTKPSRGVVGSVLSAGQYVGIQTYLYLKLGLAPWDAPVIPRINLLAFSNALRRWMRGPRGRVGTERFIDEYNRDARALGGRVFRGITVARLDAALNWAVRLWMLNQWYAMLSDKTTQLGAEIAWYFMSTTAEQRSEDELKAFEQTDLVYRHRRSLIEGAIQGYRELMNKEPPQSYIDRQYVMFNNLEAEDLGISMSPEAIARFQQTIITRTEARWARAQKEFPEFSDLDRLRAIYVAHSIEVQRNQRKQFLDQYLRNRTEQYQSEHDGGPPSPGEIQAWTETHYRVHDPNLKDPFEKARLHEDFEYWPLEEARLVLSAQDLDVLQRWRTHRLKSK